MKYLFPVTIVISSIFILTSCTNNSRRILQMPAPQPKGDYSSYTFSPGTVAQPGRRVRQPRPRANVYLPRVPSYRSPALIYPVLPTTSGRVIESRIDGTFNGWSGDTIFKLTNGQIWQQSSYGYRYRYAYRPEVLIYPTSGGYKMKVDGMDDAIFVKRLR